MKRVSHLGAAIGLAYVAVLVLAVIGYVMNLVKLVGMMDGGVSAMLIIRLVGIVAAPFGALIGWF